PPLHVPHFTTPPHPSGAVPHCAPSCAHVFATHLSDPPSASGPPASPPPLPPGSVSSGFTLSGPAHAAIEPATSATPRMTALAQANGCLTDQRPPARGGKGAPFAWYTPGALLRELLPRAGARRHAELGPVDARLVDRDSEREGLHGREHRELAARDRDGAH